MLLRNLSILFLFIISIQLQAAWRLPELARASNAVLVLMDESTISTKKSCGLSSQQVSQVSQQLQSLIDQRVNEIKNQKDQVLKLKKKCITDCSCDVYDYALEKIMPEGTAIQEVNKLNMEQRKKCYSQLKNFCHSALFKDLRK